MAFSVASVIALSRYPLNDADKIRYDDAELLEYVNSAYWALRRFRPDLFVGMWSSLPATLTLTDMFPNIGDEYKQAIADYVTARAESKDDEHVIQERAKSFFSLFAATIA